MQNGSTTAKPTLVLGIDGGGTKTACVIMDEKQTILAQVRVGSSNRNSIGDQQAKENLAQGIDSVMRAAGCERSALSAACLGMAGVDRPYERSLVNSWLEELLPLCPPRFTTMHSLPWPVAPMAIFVV
ncbi:MAG: BadF/BadG/BcrA/BcrD ATPase family protein [Caldilineaceae bacterium]